MHTHYDVAAYIWPAYTGQEPRTRMFWPEGYGEWETVKAAKPKYEGHLWPRKPLWGYVDEANPDVMEMQIKSALSHGVNVFIYDWYWFDERPFLENCLNDGFLKAPNCKDMKFYLMWANHDAVSLWDKRLSSDPFAGSNLIWKGSVNQNALEVIMDRVISRYFIQSNYYQIDGCPVFMIYDLNNLITGLGGTLQAKETLSLFREKVKAAGFRDLHLQMATWGPDVLNLSGVDSGRLSAAEALADNLGFDSVTHYQFVHFADVSKPYSNVLEQVAKEWKRIESVCSIPYFPHISIGWDNNPRFSQPVYPILSDATPENFQKGLEMAKQFVDCHPNQPPLITINSWNEWTEGSYLEPDDLYGYAYLDAIKAVFGTAE